MDRFRVHRHAINLRREFNATDNFDQLDSPKFATPSAALLTLINNLNYIKCIILKSTSLMVYLTNWTDWLERSSRATILPCTKRVTYARSRSWGDNDFLTANAFSLARRTGNSEPAIS